MFTIVILAVFLVHNSLLVNTHLDERVRKSNRTRTTYELRVKRAEPTQLWGSIVKRVILRGMLKLRMVMLAG